jgi:hypothetical protein
MCVLIATSMLEYFTVKQRTSCRRHKFHNIVKVQVVPDEDDTAGRTDTTPLILNFSSKCRRVGNFTPLSLYPWEGKKMVPAEHEAVWATGLVGMVFGEREISCVFRDPNPGPNKR